MTLPADGQRAATLLELVGANWTTQAIGAAVTLGIVDALAQAPCDLPLLARRTGCDASALQRLLRGLAAIGICEVRADGRHALTATGELLRDDVPGSVREWALWCSGPQWTLWGDLARSVRSGRSARERAGGAPGYAHLDHDVRAAATFHGAMAGLSSRIGRLIAAAADWRPGERVVDVGGGYGELLCEILAARPTLTGVLFDLPHATRDAAARLAARGLAQRCAIVSGSFFDELPAGADSYLLKSILHNWDDADALRILQRCRAAMTAGARLRIVERVLPDRPRGSRRERSILRSDLNMLVSLGGRERTRREFAQLAQQAGFGAPRRVARALDYSLLEFRPVPARRSAAARRRQSA
jgi:orsellinic acid C2-O-methyltransferase